MDYEETKLKGETFYKVKFPEFWEQACREKNAYFKRVCDRVKKHEAFLWSNLTEQDEKLLARAETDGERLSEKKRLELLWKSELCWIFNEDISVTEDQIAYCTKDMDIWLCEECFEILTKCYHWKVKPSDALFLED